MRKVSGIFFLFDINEKKGLVSSQKYFFCIKMTFFLVGKKKPLTFAPQLITVVDGAVAQSVRAWDS